MAIEGTSCRADVAQLSATVSNRVDLWYADLARPFCPRVELERFLAPEERERAGRFRFVRDRERFVASHGLLRLVLSRYLACEPQLVSYAYGPQGKPAVRPAAAGKQLRFNMAHAADLAVYAVSREYELGVDVECLRPLADRDAMAHSIMTPREITCYQALPLAQQEEAFYRTWTGKEAYLKATGEGLGGLLTSGVEVLLPGGTAGSRIVRDRWTLQALTPAPGYVGALVIEGVDPEIHAIYELMAQRP